GYDHYVQALETNHPGFMAARDAAFTAAQHSLDFRNDEIYTIPVVVHVVWQDSTQNVSDALIESVISGLNKDFRRLNEDANQIRSIFVDRVGDPKIEFELVATERVQTTATFELDLFSGSLPDEVKQSDQGGSDAWDTESYLNIWVCSIEGGALLGYAYPPAELDNWPDGVTAPSPELDGVVIHYEVFKTEGTHTAQGLLGGGEQTIPVRGRTITHEIGHYLGLRHIWGDGFSSLLGIPDCDADDGIEDTPNQGLQSQFMCDVNQNTCTDATGDLPDMFENYMDYAAEDCMNSFTLGQIDIMRGVLENQRAGLLGGPTASKDLMIEGIFSAFPNPVEDILRVSAAPTSNERYTAQLFNMLGQPVSAPLMAQGTQTLEFSVAHLPAGMYNLVLRQGQGRHVLRVVK
ncbi:MAG: M43 family zinc metalloprotease, partial [Bacteroidota bacterium]